MSFFVSFKFYSDYFPSFIVNQLLFLAKLVATSICRTILKQKPHCSYHIGNETIMGVLSKAIVSVQQL